MAGEINFTASLHRPVYQAMPNPQQAYILLEAMPGSAATSGAQAVNFSLVLDRSGSMAGDKMRQMKAAAKLVVDRLRPQDWLSVVIFDDTADLIVPAGPVQDPQAIKASIDAIQERGGTHMSTGMSAGLKELQRGQAPDRVSNMLLLTDGQTWEDQQQCEALADQCRAVGIPIQVLGLGVGAESNWDPRLLEDLAQRSGGEWLIVDAPDKVSAVFASTLQSMQGTAVSNASITMRMVEGVTPRSVWRVNPLISRLGHQAVGLHDVQVFLGDLQYGIGQAVLADLLLPPRKSGNYRLVQADITYDVPASGLTRQKVSVDVIVPFTDDPAQATATNQRLMNIIERVVAHRLQTQALDEAALGNVQKATQRLRAAATRLLELGELEMADQANQQAQQLEQAGQIDPAVAQKMRYATKRLSEAELQEAEQPSPEAIESVESEPPEPEDEPAAVAEEQPAEAQPELEDQAELESQPVETQPPTEEEPPAATEAPSEVQPEPDSGAELVAGAPSPGASVDGGAKGEVEGEAPENAQPENQPEKETEPETQSESPSESKAENPSS